MKPPFQLVPDKISHDTIKALEELLDHAKRGEVIGLAFAAMYKQRKFIVNTAGEAHRNPILTKGMLACLSEKLSCGPGREA
jgi:hypothetical protein